MVKFYKYYPCKLNEFPLTMIEASDLLDMVYNNMHWNIYSGDILSQESVFIDKPLEWFIPYCEAIRNHFEYKKKLSSCLSDSEDIEEHCLNDY